MNEEVDPTTKRLTDARFFALNGAYEESLRRYKDILAENPHDQRDLFMELMAINDSYLQTAATRVQCATATCLGRQELARLLAQPHLADPANKRLEPFGRKVFSQTDEDGIIEEIFARIGTTNKRFIEMGVETGTECNTHYLLHRGWSGAWIEGSEHMAKEAETNFGYAIDAGNLGIVKAWITAETANDLIRLVNLPSEIDLLSIDVDGQDYWVLAALDAVSPRVLVIEYNARFVPPIRHVVPYDANWRWDGSDYYGASLQSLTDLAEKKGYRLVACSMNGGNAFFVRVDQCANYFPEPATAANLYQPARFEIYRMGAFDRGHPAKAGPWLDI